MGPERLHVPHKVVGRIAIEARVDVTGMGGAPSRTTLIEQHNPVERRIEEPPMSWSASAPRPAMHYQSKLPLRVATVSQ